MPREELPATLFLGDITNLKGQMGLLRILLAIAVIVAHMNFERAYMISGGQSVKVFFMISGFYMAMILREKYGFRREGLWGFAKNRFLRLYPLYLFIFVATVLWYQTCKWVTHGGTPEPLLLRFGREVPFRESLGFWVANLGLVGADLPSLFHWHPEEGFRFFADIPHERSNGFFWMGSAIWVGQAWSVGAEIWFYASAPLIVFLPRFRTRFAVWAGLCVFTLQMQASYPEPAHVFWPALLSYFATGVLLFDGYKRFDLSARVARWDRFVKFGIYISPLVWVVMLPIFGVQLPNAVQNVLGAFSIPLLFSITASNRLDRLIGELSYGVYLNHVLVISIVSILARRWGLPVSSMVVVVIMASCGGAYVTNIFVERPIERIRARISRAALCRRVVSNPTNP